MFMFEYTSLPFLFSFKSFGILGVLLSLFNKDISSKEFSWVPARSPAKTQFQRCANIVSTNCLIYFIFLEVMFQHTLDNHILILTSRAAQESVHLDSQLRNFTASHHLVIESPCLHFCFVCTAEYCSFFLGELPVRSAVLKFKKISNIYQILWTAQILRN